MVQESNGSRHVSSLIRTINRLFGLSEIVYYLELFEDQIFGGKKPFFMEMWIIFAFARKIDSNMVFNSVA